MIGSGTVLGLIPARGGSRGVSRKNIRLLGGKPVLGWTADAAHSSRYLDRVVLSTDDEEIAAVGRSLGLDVPFIRPAAAATDEATASDVVEHAVRSLPEAYEYLVYLQPTSPFRSAADIDGCLDRLVGAKADTCVSVTESPTKPEWLFHLDGQQYLQPVIGSMPKQRRQELTRAFELNGAVYATRVDLYLRIRTFLTERTLAWVMPPERSVDLDEVSDFERAEQILQRSPRVDG